MTTSTRAGDHQDASDHPEGAKSFGGLSNVCGTNLKGRLSTESFTRQPGDVNHQIDGVPPGPGETGGKINRAWALSDPVCNSLTGATLWLLPLAGAGQKQASTSVGRFSSRVQLRMMSAVR